MKIRRCLSRDVGDKRWQFWLNMFLVCESRASRLGRIFFLVTMLLCISRFSELKTTGAGAAIRSSLTSLLSTCMQTKFYDIKISKETKPRIQGPRRAESTAVMITEKYIRFTHEWRYVRKSLTFNHPKSKTVTVRETELLRRILVPEKPKAKQHHGPWI